jgi:hypothetical protein
MTKPESSGTSPETNSKKSFKTAFGVLLDAYVKKEMKQEDFKMLMDSFFKKHKISVEEINSFNLLEIKPINPKTERPMRHYSDYCLDPMYDELKVIIGHTFKYLLDPTSKEAVAEFWKTEFLKYATIYFIDILKIIHPDGDITENSPSIANLDSWIEIELREFIK